MKKRKNNTLSSFDIQKYSESFDQIWFWCDYFRLVYSNPIDKFEYYFNLLDYDNSNFWFVEYWWFTLTYQKIPTSIWSWLTFSIEYSWVSVPIFQFVRFNKQTKEMLWYYWKIDIYSAFYRLVDLWYLKKYFVHEYLISLSWENPLITRYDFRIDYFNKYWDVFIPLPEDVLSVSTQSRVEVHKRWWLITNRWVWSKKSWKYYIRLYDKKIDTDSKWKWILYTDYLCYSSVHRFEIQFQSAFCRWFHLSDLIKLEDKIYTTLWLSTLYDWIQFYTYDSSKEINEYNKWSHIQRFNNQTKKFVNAWYNPFVLMYDTIVNLYGVEFAEDSFTDFLQSYDFKFNITNEERQN